MYNFYRLILIAIEHVIVLDREDASVYETDSHERSRTTSDTSIPSRVGGGKSQIQEYILDGQHLRPGNVDITRASLNLMFAL